jgi:glycosyltransferase involved in cell wall biosynthesis
VRVVMANSISWLLPVQKTAQRTLAAVSRIRDAAQGQAEIILIDGPGATGHSRNLPSDVLRLSLESLLPLPYLLQAALAAADGDVVLWSPHGEPISSVDLRRLTDYVIRHDALVLATQTERRFSGTALRGRLTLRLSHSFFVARRATAKKVAQRLCFWGDFPVSTAAILAMMQVPLFIPRRHAPSPAAQTPVGRTDETCRELAPIHSRAREQRHPGPVVSAIITAHNEGEEVLRTIESVEANTSAPVEFIVVDDGSTDGCCDHLRRERISVIRHESRVGVAFSRNAGAAAARGDVLLFLDGHQRVSAGCLDRCAEVALAKDAVVWPDVRTLHDRGAVGHGASFRLGKNDAPFTAAWNNHRGRQSITRITSLRSPGYFVPRKVFGELRWISQLRGWGGSEAALALKAFFLGVDILHVCGPLARHLFRPKFQYTVTDAEVSRNHALIARVCFDDRTWFEYWLPRVFEGCLSPEAICELDSPEVIAEHAEFLKVKRRPDQEFWRGLLRRKQPAGLSSPGRARTTGSVLAGAATGPCSIAASAPQSPSR